MTQPFTIHVPDATDERVEVPTACALFPKELLAWPPRSYVERLYNIQQWTEFSRGGHFAAMEEPELLIDDIRLFTKRANLRKIICNL